MSFYTKKWEDVLEELKVKRDTGVLSEEVSLRKEKYGANEFSKVQGKSMFKKILHSFSDPLVVILLIAAFISIAMNIYNVSVGNHSEFAESIGIVIAILLSVSIQLIMEGRSEKAFQTLNAINDDIFVKVKRDGKFIQISKGDVVVGDIVKFESGDKLPCDGRLLEGFEVMCDESMLTGESLSVSKDSELVLAENIPLGDRKNMLYGGSYITSGQGVMVATYVGDSTEMGKIAKELTGNSNKVTPLQEKLNVLAKRISFLGLAAAAFIFVVELVRMFQGDTITFAHVQEAFMVSVALIVASVPEGLPTIVAMTLAINVIKMAKGNALVRKMVATETIGSVNVICSDKTGTLTKNVMEVNYTYENGKLLEGTEPQSIELRKNFALNSTADITYNEEKLVYLGDPTEGALLLTLKEKRYSDFRSEEKPYFSIPFNSKKKTMTTVLSLNPGKLVLSKGSPENILGYCKFINIDGAVVPLNEEKIREINDLYGKYQNDGKRILGFAHKEVRDDFKMEESLLESEMIFAGFVVISDPLRDDVIEAVNRCNGAGISVKMLTGDHLLTAKSIAQELGIIHEGSLIMEGSDVEALDDEELEKIIDKIAVIARSTPNSKMRIVNLLKKRGNVVAVTGDGINDAPALKNADVGIAMGITGTEVSKEASDIILLDDAFSTIVKAVEWGRGLFENFRRFIQFQLTVNVIAVLVVIICEITGQPMPFTTLQLLWVNIIMDGPPAVALGMEGLRKGLMDDKPVPRDEGIINRDMVAFIFGNGIFMVIMLFILILNPGLLGGTEAMNSTIVFTSFVLFQLFNSFNARVVGKSSIFKGLSKNNIMFVTIVVTFLLQIGITQFGSSVFGTVPLPVDVWVKIIGFTLSIFVFSEVVRFIRRKIYK